MGARLPLDRCRRHTSRPLSDEQLELLRNQLYVVVEALAGVDPAVVRNLLRDNRTVEQFESEFEGRQAPERNAKLKVN